MIIPTFVGTLPERLSALDEVLSNQWDIRMVGSSFGGLMGALFAMENEARVKRLTLLAPAIHMIDLAPRKNSENFHSRTPLSWYRRRGDSPRGG